MSTVRPASEPGAGAKTSSVFAKACVGCAVTLAVSCRASTKIVPWCGALRRRREASVALYAIDAKHLLRRRRRDDLLDAATARARASTKTARNSKARMQRWPSTGNDGRSATPAAASPPMLRRETAAWGVRMLLQARRSRATSTRCRIIVRV